MTNTVLTEGRHDDEFIISLANGDRSIETGTVAANTALEPGQIVQEVGGELTPITAVANTPVGVVRRKLEANAASTTPGQPYVARDATLLESSLTYFTGISAADQTAMNVKLEALGIITR